MISPLRSSMDDLLANNDAISAALGRAVREALMAHARAGQPVASLREGKVVWIPPEEILAHFSGGEKRIPPPVHRRAPRMRRLPVKRDGMTLHPEGPEHRAQR